MVVNMECEPGVTVVYRDFKGRWVGEEKIAWAGTAVQSCLIVRNIGIPFLKRDATLMVDAFVRGELVGNKGQMLWQSRVCLLEYLPKGGV